MRHTRDTLKTLPQGPNPHTLTRRGISHETNTGTFKKRVCERWANLKFAEDIPI